MAKSADRVISTGGVAPGNLILRSDQIRRIYNNQASNKQVFISPASVGTNGAFNRKNPGANTGYSKALNNSAATEGGVQGATSQMFDQTYS